MLNSDFFRSIFQNVKNEKNVGKMMKECIEIKKNH